MNDDGLAHDDRLELKRIVCLSVGLKQEAETTKKRGFESFETFPLKKGCVERRNEVV